MLMTYTEQAALGNKLVNDCSVILQEDYRCSFVFNISFFTGFVTLTKFG